MEASPGLDDSTPSSATHHDTPNIDSSDDKNKGRDNHDRAKMTACIALLVLTSCAVHCIVVLGMFDTYFVSPVVHGMPPQFATAVDDTVQPPAKRLVLIISDGLRADTFFETWVEHTAEGPVRKSRVPFLRSIIKRRGAYGVSHTHVPTESRPGHVALIAGLYEDVSAVFKGWKSNPVEFDSMLNRSSHAFCFGSPDICPMFTTNVPHAHEYTYSNQKEDFAARDTSLLDTWVFERARKVLEQADRDAALARKLDADGTMIMLHLLGVDTSGHADKPASMEYQHNVEVVDRGVQEFYERMEKRYPDGKTAYVFTSDHGMSNRGSHGDGDPDNTRTPLVVWGAGVRGPRLSTRALLHAAKTGKSTVEDGEHRVSPGPQPRPTRVTGLRSQRGLVVEMSPGSPKDSSGGLGGWDELAEEAVTIGSWDLGEVVRHDVHQADIAPLMASLIGVPVPVNSVGVMPVDYLLPGRYRVRALQANAEQILATVHHRSSMRRNRSLVFRSFPYLESAQRMLLGVDQILKSNPELQRYDVAEALAMDAAGLGLQGLTYFQTYDWIFLMGSMGAAYIGWALVQGLFIAAWYGPRAWRRWLPERKSRWYIGCTVGLVVVELYLLVEQNPWKYALYGALPIVFWSIALSYPTELLRWTVALGVLPKPPLVHKVPKRGQWGVVGSGGAALSRERARERARKEAAARTSATPQRAKSVAFQARLSPTGVVLLCGVVAVELTVIGYHYRACFAAMVLMLALVPWTTPHMFAAAQASSARAPRTLQVAWTLTCMALSVFPFLPVDLTYSPGQLVAGSVSIVVMAVVTDIVARRHAGDVSPPRWLLPAQALAVLVATAVVVHTQDALARKQGLPKLNQALAWGLTVGSPLLILAAPPAWPRRLAAVLIGLAPGFVLLSLSYEVLFYAALCTAGMLWVALYDATHDATAPLVAVDTGAVAEGGVRPQRAVFHALAHVPAVLMFACLFNLAFFGTGNVASISSFEISSTYRFATVFAPHLMGALLVLKLLIPFFAVTSAFSVTLAVLRAPLVAVFVIYLIFCDAVGLNFLFLVKNEGSWKDIGNSISHFCIVNAKVLWAAPIFAVAWAFTAATRRHIAAKQQRDYNLAQLDHSGGNRRHQE